MVPGVSMKLPQHKINTAIWFEDKKRRDLSDRVLWRMKTILYGQPKAKQYWKQLLVGIMGQLART